MRYIAPQRGTVDPAAFSRWPLSGWREYAAWLESESWPLIAQLNAARPVDMAERFEAQTPSLLGDGLHYEQRIAQRGVIATREANWHDLFNAMVWLRHGALKRALNAQQVAEIGHMGPRERSRPQYAMTHFDEAGVIVMLRDHALLELWDAHDWHGLFWRQREAWLDGRARLEVFGHALLEHALTPDKLLVGKALVVVGDAPLDHAVAHCARAIGAGQLLRDPLELRPLPLSGLPGWHPANGCEDFHREAACYQPRRAGRSYPQPLQIWKTLEERH
ncbi:DUF3025 domain-containing protein [Dyella solisilvae]|uniref:DUF3025 domain-containing protein n=1 Tax=Dyella solisilvae TaxID=1920168 RepID=A0A370K6T4_9GAMM|nr:DUF3025 domain-containing protein [Dyella solisilvae]RDI98167.1 DUF3025 domain-containing protein [Dyella solisilvae]